MSDDALPPGWVGVPLGTLAAGSRKTIDPRKSPSEEFELYSIPAHPTRLPEIVAGSSIGSAKQQVAPGTVLVGRINPRINRVWVVSQQQARRQIASTEWLGFPPRDGIEPEYLAYYFLRQEFRHLAASNVSGVGGSLMRLNFAAVSNHSVPIAPQRQQAHIVQALDSYYSRLVSAEGTLDRVRRALSQLNASLLQAAVEGRLVLTEAELSPTEHREYEPASDFLERILSERRRRWEKSNGSGEYHEPAGPEETTLPKLPAGWCWTTMAQLGEISGGLTQHHRREALQLQMPFLRVANVYADELRLDDVAMIGVTPEEVRRTLLEPGDLLVVEGNGSASQIGRVASWNGAIKRCLHQNHLIKTRFAFPQLSAWVKMFLLSPRGRSLIQAVSSSTSGLHTLSISKVAHLPIPLAPEQEILRALGALGTAQDCVAPAIAAAHRAELMCRGLRSSILALAFSGRLVDQDSSGAPGSAVHDRMLAARATAEAAKPSNTSSNPKRT